MAVSTMLDEIKARQNKELKALEGEKRAELKKTKGTAGKGQKAKDILAALEAKYDERLVELKAKHADELSNAATSEATAQPDDETVKADTATQSSLQAEEPADGEHDKKVSKADKARRKREKAREKERQRERDIQDEMDNAGPSQKDVEMEMLLEKLAPLNLAIEDVVADGHCLYRAVAKSCGKEFTEIRRLCAETLEKNQDEFAPFCDYTDTVSSFQQYTDRVRNSADWGGHLELRALSIALERPMVIYQAQVADPLQIEHSQSTDDPIRLSYHRHYYALGEHYNLVVNKS